MISITANNTGTQSAYLQSRVPLGSSIRSQITSIKKTKCESNYVDPLTRCRNILNVIQLFESEGIKPEGKT